MKKFTCASFFAGVGGIDLGFELTNKFETIYANEFDKFPAETFNLNNKIQIDLRSIEDVLPEEIPDFDVMLAGFPCTDISIAGAQKGLINDDGTLTRSGLFFELVRILKVKKPRVVFLENVKNLVGHNNGETFKAITDALTEVGYPHIKFAVLNAKDYGNVPQNRERIYIVAFNNIEDKMRFDFPLPIPLTTPLSSIIDFKGQYDEKYYYTPGKFKSVPYDVLDSTMDDPNAVYQWRRVYLRKNKSGVVPTLTANQGEGGHNVCIVRTETGIRKMLPIECFKAQGFPANFKLPEQADSRLYKQAGNSVCVTVIERIATEIAKIFV